jgi:hypothetical protein
VEILQEASNSTQGPVSAKLVANGTTILPGLSQAQLTQSVLNVLDSMYIGSGGSDYVLATNVQSFFQLLSATNNGSRQEAFMDPQLLLDLGSSVWKGISSQIVYEYLTVPVDEIVSGDIRHKENRLHVKLLPTVLMAAMLSLLCGAAIVIIMSRPRNITPCDPTSTLAKAALFAASPTVMEALADLGLSQMNKIQDALSFHTLRSRFPRNAIGAFHIELISKGPCKESSRTLTEDKEDDRILWWTPIATKHWFLCVAVLLPVSVIATLELLQHISDTEQGLVPVDPGNTLSLQVLAHYLPAAIMLIIGTLFTSIRDTTAIFAPYSELKRGDAPVSSMAHNLVGRMAIQALLFSGKTLSVGHFVSLLAVLVVPFLTIVVSGLYTAVPVYTGSNMTLTLTDRFKFTQSDL